MPKVHEQEGEVIENIDCCKVLVEFETVEKGWLFFEKADVAQDKVAMAAAYLSLLPTPVEKRPKLPKRLPESGGQFVRLRCWKQRRST